MREPIGIGQQQRYGRDTSAEPRQRRMKRAISGVEFVHPLLLGRVFTARFRVRVIAGRRRQARRFRLRHDRIRWHRTISSADGF